LVIVLEQQGIEFFGLIIPNPQWKF